DHRDLHSFPTRRSSDLIVSPPPRPALIVRRPPLRTAIARHVHWRQQRSLLLINTIERSRPKPRAPDVCMHCWGFSLSHEDFGRSRFASVRLGASLGLLPMRIAHAN